MRVGLITYQAPHKKTLDLTLKLFTRGHTVTWFAFPFGQRTPKSDAPYPDRPAQIMDFDTKAFCRQHGVKQVMCDGWSNPAVLDIEPQDIFLTCIAKIIPGSFLDDRVILNCHPGLLPKNRGVDAFKWSIVNGWPIGVTLHAIDERIDGGTILFCRTVPILSSDTLLDVCRRAYEFECDLLANFDAHIFNLNRHWLVSDEHPVSHKRIPKHIDAVLDQVFLDRKHELLEGVA
jgi:folate-dependent phosphoribosylglycinamide formyltransferase PurN